MVDLRDDNVLRSDHQELVRFDFGDDAVVHLDYEEHHPVTARVHRRHRTPAEFQSVAKKHASIVCMCALYVVI